MPAAERGRTRTRTQRDERNMIESPVVQHFTIGEISLASQQANLFRFRTVPLVQQLPRVYAIRIRADYGGLITRRRAK